MGCAASSIDKEESVRICKERKRLMKQLVGFRGEFADAQLAYLRALKNTGSTLRQFTESETLELENTTYGLLSPPSPPPPLPPSPPPPPPFSPDLRKVDPLRSNNVSREEIIDIDEKNSSISPPPLILSSSWDSFWDPFDSPSLDYGKKNGKVEALEEENWAETKSEFEEEEEEKSNCLDVVDDNSSMEEATVSMVITWKNKKTLEGIVKELDEYFLKSSSGIKEIAVLIDISRGDNISTENFKEIERKNCNSAKVFNALSWSWSFKSLQLNQDMINVCDPSEPCRPGAHCATLKKLYSAEQKLYKDIKDEEIIKIKHERKLVILQRQEDDNHDWAITEKTRSIVETMEAEIIRLQRSRSQICSSILTFIDEELHPQLIALISGLQHMWKRMLECHRAQNSISMQLNYLSNDHGIDLSSDYHRHATFQLETEVTSWYNNFCRLVKSQREYVGTLCRWIQLTQCLVNDEDTSIYAANVRNLCEKWQLSLDKLPDKAAAEAIKSLLLAVQLIQMQQTEEHNLQKKAEKLEKRLEKESNFIENKAEGYVNSSANDSLSIKRAKIEALKKQTELEKAKYMNSVQVSREMTLNNFKLVLPKLFQALIEFSNSSVHAFEAVSTHFTPADSSLNV